MRVPKQLQTFSRTMTSADELQPDASSFIEYHAKSLNDSPTISCPSFVSASTPSSRRDSISSLSFETNPHSENNQSFSLQQQVVDVRDLSLISSDDLEIPSQPTSSLRKSNNVWTSEPTIRLSEAQSLGTLSCMDPIYGQHFQSDDQQAAFDGCLPNSSLDDMLIDFNVAADSESLNGIANTIMPSITLSGQAEIQQFNMWVSSHDHSMSAVVELNEYGTEEMQDSWEDSSHIYTPTSTPPGSQPMDEQNYFHIPRRRHSHCNMNNPLQKSRSCQVSVPGNFPRPLRQSWFCKECKIKFQRPEHFTRHKKSAKHSNDCPYQCELDGCNDKKTNKRNSFNRKDNYQAHVINCHLIESDKPRRTRITDPAIIEKLGWTRLLPLKRKEEEKRRRKSAERGDLKQSSVTIVRGRVPKRQTAKLLSKL